MRRPTLPLAVQQVIRAQPGRVAHTRTIAEVGPDRHAVSAWVRQGLLDRLAPAWVRLPGDEAPLQAGHLAVGYLERFRPGATIALSDEYALGLLIPSRALPALPMVLVEHGRRLRVRSGPWDVHQRSTLDPADLAVTRGLPHARAPLALADRAATRIADDGLLAIVYEVINATRIRPTALVSAWTRLDHPGARRLLELTAAGALEHESPAELRLFRDVFAGHPPLPDCQVMVTDRIRVDFMYIFAALVIEYLGEQSHANRVDADGARLYAMRTLDLETIIVTKSVARDPVGLRAHIHRTRLEREDLMLRGLLRRPPLPRQPDRLTPLRTLGPGG